jgi:Sulfatase
MRGRPVTKPKVLLIPADDVRWFDVGAYNRGITGGPTPNIDRIAREGVLLTDCYAQANCTAGRAALITGQLPMRTGLTTLPGAPQGLRLEDPTLADLLKPDGYMTARSDKNHLGDRNEYLPTVHGLDEFHGNLYHLNAEEEPEQELENPFPGQERLVRWTIDAADCAAPGQPPDRSISATSGCPRLPALRRGKAVDYHASRLHPEAARGNLQGFPAKPGTAGLQSRRDLEHGIKAATNGV